MRADVCYCQHTASVTQKILGKQEQNVTFCKHASMHNFLSLSNLFYTLYTRTVCVKTALEAV